MSGTLTQLILSTNVKVLSLTRLFRPSWCNSTFTAIRVFGIFTHVQLHHGRFWDNLSRQLQQRGPEYTERCIFRNKPLSAGDGVILPTQFPPLPHQVQDISQPVPLVKASEEDMKDVSEMACVFQIQ